MTWTPVAKVEEVVPGKALIVKVGKREIGLYHESGRYYAVLNFCPHAGAPICRGQLTGRLQATVDHRLDYCPTKPILRCPWHHWEFDLEDGKAVVADSGRLKVYAVRENQGSIEVEI